MSQTSVVYPPMGSCPRQGDEHPTYALLWSMAHLPYLIEARFFLPIHDFSKSWRNFHEIPGVVGTDNSQFLRYCLYKVVFLVPSVL